MEGHGESIVTHDITGHAFVSTYTSISVSMFAGKGKNDFKC